MRFNTTDIPDDRLRTNVRLGDVYKAKGGSGDTTAFVVVAIRERQIHMLGIDESGDIVSTTSYGDWSFKSRKLIGVCEQIAELELSIEATP